MGLVSPLCSGDREVGLCVRRWFLLSVVEIGRWDFVQGGGFSSLVEIGRWDFVYGAGFSSVVEIGRWDFV